MEPSYSFIQKASKGFLFALLTIISVVLSFLIAKNGAVIAYSIVFLIFGVSIVILTISNFRNGFLLMIIYSFFLFEIGRLVEIEFPFGAFIEVFLILIFIGVVVQSFNVNNDESVFKNPIGYAILLYVGYTLLEMVNPNSSSISARLLAIREIVAFVLTFFVVMHVFKTYRYIVFFTKFWLFFALLAALYGMYQEYFGIPDFEMRWLYASPERYKLAFIWGRLRKWSFLSDINAFGLFMAYSGIICAILALGPYKIKARIVLAVSALIMFISMSYSGTRTATAMVIVGFAFYVFMTITNRRTLVFAVVAVIAFLSILYGPFYGATFSRIRTTFRGSEDASMSVRDVKRARLQPYVQSHPFGGGINTAGNVGLRYEPGHPISGSFDPDSGYLRMALERGWIGLIVNLILYSTILIYAAHQYYKAHDPKIKILYAAYMAGFFSLSIAHFTQDAMDQKPVTLILISSYAFMIKLIKFDSSTKLNTSSET